MHVTKLTYNIYNYIKSTPRGIASTTEIAEAVQKQRGAIEHTLKALHSSGVLKRHNTRPFQYSIPTLLPSEAREIVNNIEDAEAVYGNGGLGA